ncbi:F-box protein At5g03100-like [Magnolia sinica]|uniref:F-box protein At5g03100-like n=1 Tax=Magnolia sinica TaxID=86752 RepID=UPI00265A431C|nr:F-box protein At5g03100-like [Magnolia sinica]
MEKTNDRISQLPDDVLHYILSKMPMKFIIRTSILSRRWRNLWKPIWAYSTYLNFSVTPEEFVAAVNRYLLLHEAKEIHTLGLLLLSRDPLDAEKWVEFAVAKRVKELHVIFCQTTVDETFDRRIWKLHNSIFNCDSLTYLHLCVCKFIPPLNFRGCTYLKTLDLSFVRITDALFENMLLNFQLLKEFSLWECVDLTHLKISAPNLPLTRLTVVDCWNVNDIEIFAPNLQSFHFYGDLFLINFKNISSLLDVLINGICRMDWLNGDWMTVLHHLERVKILTLCNVSLKNLSLAEEDTPEDLPITFLNLQELQLLMDWFGGSYLARTYSFFKNCLCPCLEKLFIELLYAIEDPSQRNFWCDRQPADDTADIVFCHLKVIKINGFRGLKDEIQLVKFFLEKAIVLESLVLVAPQKAVSDMMKDSASESKSIKAQFVILHDLLLNFAKASSSDAQILMYEYSDYDGALAPTHAEYYHKDMFV